MKAILLGVTVVALSAPSTIIGPPADQDSLASRLQTNAQVYFADARHVETWHPLKARLSQVSTDRIFTMDTLCVYSTGVEPSADTGYGWSLNVTPIEETSESLTVRTEWQRVKERSQPIDGPKALVELTLKAGQWIPLDYIPAGPVPAGRRCNAVGILLRIGIPLQ